MMCAETVLFHKSKLGDISILKDNRVATIKDDSGYTPLHWLASEERYEIMTHPDANVVKNNCGLTPMNILEEKLSTIDERSFMFY